MHSLETSDSYFAWDIYSKKSADSSVSAVLWLFHLAVGDGLWTRSRGGGTGKRSRRLPGSNHGRADEGSSRSAEFRQDCWPFNDCSSHSEVRLHLYCLLFLIILSFLHGICFFASSVTRVGDTLGGNWGCHPFIFSWNTDNLFLLIIYFTQVSPPPSGVCHPAPYYLSDLISTLFFVNLPTKFFPSSVTPLEGVTQGGPSPQQWRHCFFVCLSL